MALDPTALPADPDTSQPQPDAIAPAVAPGEGQPEPSAAAQEPPKYTAEEWFSSPEYQSRKDKEIARWQKAESDRIAADSAQAERSRFAQAQMDRARRAHVEGDLEAQAELARDAYFQLIQQQTAEGTISSLGQKYEKYVSQLTAGDAEAASRLSYTKWTDAEAWLDAVTAYRVAKEAGSQAETLAEAKRASERALERDGKPNPDTAEMVGGHGGPVASLSLDELNARYAKAKDDGNPEEVARLKTVLRQRDPVMAGRR